MTRILQVTDTHIPMEGDLSVQDNFRRIMAFCADNPPDLLTITGDLPDVDGNRAAYEWIAGELPRDIPYFIIPGNHDDRDSLFEVFKSSLNQNPEFMEKIALDEIDVVFVDSGPKILAADQIAYFSSNEIRPGSILFIHHPTKEISGGFMDVTYPLENRETVDEAIRGSSVSHVFCGHFHTEFEIHADYHLYVTPSPAFEVSRDSVEPKVSPPRIPLREILIEGKSVTTQVIYLDDSF